MKNRINKVKTFLFFTSGKLSKEKEERKNHLEFIKMYVMT